jgi:hypothetical protein
MFELKPGNKLISLLLFLEASGIDFTVTDRQMLVDGLIPERDNPYLTPSLLYNLKLLDIVELLPESFDGVKQIIKKMEALPPGDHYRKPNAAFKHFCGAEALTASGCITRDQALDCVYRYVELKSLRNGQDIITLDRTLQDALGSGLGYIQGLSLANLVESIF